MASSIRSITTRLVLCSRNACRIFPSVTKFHSEDKASRFVIFCSFIFHHCLLSELYLAYANVYQTSIRYSSQLATATIKSKKTSIKRKLSVKQRPSFIQRSPQSNTFTVKCCKRINTSEPCLSQKPKQLGTYSLLARYYQITV